MFTNARARARAHTHTHTQREREREGGREKGSKGAESSEKVTAGQRERER